MGKHITVVPSYGRDYKSQAEVQRAYDEGKDFRVQDLFSEWNGMQVSKREAVQYSLTLNVRYARLTKSFSPVAGRPDIEPEESHPTSKGFRDLLESDASFEDLEDYIGDGDMAEWL